MASTGRFPVVITPKASRGWIVSYVKRANRWVRLG